PTMPAAASLLANAPGEDGARWTEIPGLGRSGRAVTILPFTAPARSLAESALAPRLDYTLEFPASGAFTLHLHVLPTHPISGAAHRFAVALDEQPPQLVELQSADGDAVWTRAVLDNERLLKVPLAVPNSGRHLLHLWGLAPGIVIDRVRVAATAPAR
ncbi:MAG TPA: hypothetical protein VK178_15830, partial [Opitutaceae bacterium]|nr:hypothetical protein [Opitutaceae bacterium]